MIFMIRRWIWALSLLLLPIATQAQTYFWVGGPGAWTDLTKWAACSGCAGGAFVQVPQSNNDVVIDANSGFGLVPVANRTITLPSLANSTCRNLTITPNAANFRISGGTRMDVYGDITLEPTLVAQNLWSGDLFLFGTGTHTHTLNNVRLYNTTISIEPTGGQHTIDRFNSATTLRINPTALGTARFTTSFVGQTVNHVSGTTTFDCPVTGYTATSRLGTFTSSGGFVIANQSFRANNFSLSGGTNTFNAFTHLGTFTLSGNATVANFAATTHEWTRLDAQTTNTSTLNIAGATITNLVNWFLYSPNTIFNSTGSTLDFNVSASNFVPGGEVYNIVRFRFFANLRANDGSGTGNPNGSFNQISFDRGFRSMAAATYTVLANGALTMRNGGLYNGDVGGTIMLPPLITFNIGNSAQVDIQGSCANKLYMRHVAFTFGATPAITMDNVRMELVSATGANTPYPAGANSYGISTTGWNAGASAVDAPRTGRYLRWVGAPPADIANAAQYADWHNPANWANGNLHPAAMPGSGLGGECPPTMWDSVVFDNGSYVRVDSPFIETRSMIWLGSGNFRNQNFTNNAALLEVFGSLQWSAPMGLLYNGVIKFRAAESDRTIRSNGQSFPFRVAIETIDDAGHYSMLDNMRLPSTAAEFTLDLRRGGISTQGHTLEAYRLCANNTTNVRRLDIANSTINITGNAFSAATNAATTVRYCFETNSTVNNLSISAANSHIHVLYPGDASTTNMRILLGSGYAFHNITFYGDRPWLLRQNTVGTTSYNEVVFRHSGTIYGYNGTRDSFHILRTHTIDPDAINTFAMQEASTTSAMVVDSAFYNGNVSFVRPIDYSQLMYLARGHAYSLDAAATRRQLIRDGGRLDAQGTCTQTISISGGRFTSNTPQFADYLILNNNAAGSAVFSHSNTIEVGTVTGWVGTTATPRNLYWYNSGVGANIGAWDDNRNWSLADGIMLDMNGGSDPNVGNCPPTRVDNVYFTPASFDSPSDIVRIALEPARYAECADMIWTSTAPNGGILQSASANERINVFGSLEWSAAMNNSFMGDIYMRATTLGHAVRSNSIAFRRGLVFTGVGGEWTLQDELLVPNAIPSGYGLYLQSGTLRTNNQTVRTVSFYSNYATARALFAGTSQFYISSGGVAVDMRGSLFTLDVSQTEFFLTSSTNNTTNFQFLTYPNTVYNNISFTHSNGRGRITGTGNTFNVLHLQNAGFLALTNCTVDSVLSLATAAANTFAIISPNNIFGTVQIAGNAAFQTNNRYINLLELSPARTYTFTSGTVQHLANGAHFQAIGTGGGGEIFFNTTSTGAQAYIRKDSGQICVDFIYMRDIWAIGNGVSTQTACAAAACDTAQISSLAPTFATSGRAIFQGGGNANDQGNNAGWDFTPYPPVPQLRLRYVPPFAVCTNEPYVAVFEIVGQFPIDVSYSLEYGGTIYQIDSFDVRPTQGSGTAADPYIWYVSFMPSPIGITTVAADDVAVVRCFNNTAAGLGENDAFVAPCLLPLEVLSFVASCNSQSQDADLYWRTTGSADIAAFAVEHSADGIQYQTAAEIAAPLGKTDFYFTHAEAATNSVNYYRLRQINRDGTSDYSRIVAADCRQDEAPSATMRLFPNPARSLVNIQFTANTEGNVDIELIDLLGKSLLRSQLPANAGDNLLPLNLPDALASGLYLVRLTTADGSTQQRELTVLRR